VYSLAFGPDGNPWFIDAIYFTPVPPGSPNAWLDRLDVGTGVITSFPLPPRAREGAQVVGLTVGPDGNFWYGEDFGSRVNKVDLASAVTASAAIVTATVGVPYSGAFASFNAAARGASASQYSAMIDFGDGTIVPGTVSADASGEFVVSAAHTFDRVGIFRVTVSIVYQGLTVATAVDQTTVGYGAPSVTAVQRFGAGTEPTEIVLSFSTPLSGTTAGDLSNYDLRPVGPRGHRGRPIPIRAVAYDAALHTVTLTPRFRLRLGRVFELTVNGKGSLAVAGENGLALAGDRAGHPGSNFRVLMRGFRTAFPR